MRVIIPTALVLLGICSGFGCQGDVPYNPTPLDQANHSPVITSLACDRTTIEPGGVIQVTVLASDADHDPLVPEYKAEHGIWTRRVDTVWQAQYTHDGSPVTSDTITVTVRDPRNGQASKSQTITIQAK